MVSEVVSMNVDSLTERDDVDDKDSVLKRSELEVDELDERPDHPVLGEGALVGRVDLLLGVGALHDSHVVEEHEQVGGCQDGLIKTDASDNFSVGSAGETDAVLEETEPLGSEGTEDGW